jgi:asparagine synthetase B (glutamine-hydrolysing)
VVYDSVQRQAFAARDSSGDEKLYYSTTDNATISFTNDPRELPDEMSNAEWLELPPGHFISGRTPKLSQFALSRVELQNLEAEMDSCIYDTCSKGGKSTKASMDSHIFYFDD